MPSDRLEGKVGPRILKLSSTKLRKHVSTLSTVINLRDYDMDILANVLGHEIRVHTQDYRLPEGTLQLAKVSIVPQGNQPGPNPISPNEEEPEAMDSDL